MFGVIGDSKEHPESDDALVDHLTQRVSERMTTKMMRWAATVAVTVVVGYGGATSKVQTLQDRLDDDTKQIEDLRGRLFKHEGDDRTTHGQVMAIDAKVDAVNAKIDAITAYFGVPKPRKQKP